MRQTRRSIAAKIQTVAGTPETLTAADVFFAEDIQLSPEVEQLMRPHHLPTLSQLAPVAGRSRMSASCKVPMYGASAAGSAPFWGALLQGCGWAESLVALTSAKYLPATTGHKILTLKVFVDGVSFRIRDAKGSWSIEFKAGLVPYFSFKFDGIWEPLTDADAFKDEALLEGNALPSFLPKPFKAALLSIGGTHFGVSEGFKLDSGNKLVYVPDANITTYKRVDISSPRELKGEIDQEAVLKAVYDFWGKLAGQTAVAIQGYLGADDGNTTGTGTLNTMTDLTKNWITNQFSTNWSLLDSAGASFAITSNTGSALTVSGTPATGAYLIYQPGKLIRVKIPKAVFSSISDGNKDGNWHHGLPFMAALTAGDDEGEFFVI